MQGLTKQLNEWSRRICCNDGTAVVAELCDELNRLRASSCSEEWLKCVVEPSRRHPIHRLLLEDPYTARAFQKPRGYAGDAVMLDYVYDGTPPLGTSSFGQDIFRGTTGSTNGQSVVARRNLLSQRIDEIAASQSNARILSIACGHMREALLSEAVATHSISELIAFDQDIESLAVVATEFSQPEVRTVHGSVIDLIRGRISFSGFDFVYAAGLFDYLTDSIARRLFKLMLGMLSAGRPITSG